MMKRALVALIVAFILFFMSACAAHVRPAPRLTIEEAVVQHMNLMYVMMQGEWAMCLRGSHDPKSNVVRVDDISAALVLHASVGNVVYRCYATSDIIGTWHPHPSRSCAFSQNDSLSLAEGPWKASIISCGMPPTINVLFHPSIRADST